MNKKTIFSYFIIALIVVTSFILIKTLNGKKDATISPSKEKIVAQVQKTAPVAADVSNEKDLTQEKKNIETDIKKINVADKPQPEPEIIEKESEPTLEKQLVQEPTIEKTPLDEPQTKTIDAIKTNLTSIDNFIEKSPLSKVDNNRLLQIDTLLKTIKKKRFIRRGHFFVNESGNRIQTVICYGDHNMFFDKDGQLNIKVTLDHTSPALYVHFDYNVSSEVVKSEESALNDLIKEISIDKKNIDKIIIIGNASLPGDDDYNSKLGLSRAIYIANIIEKEGINILSISNGEYNPIVEENTEEGNAKNQRAEIIIIKN